MKHTLKIWPEYFEPVVAGTKTFEVRIEDDRKFTQGDQLHLQEWDRVNQKFTGRDVVVDVLYILRADNTTYLQQGVAVLAIKAPNISDIKSAGTKLFIALEHLIPTAERYKDEMTTFGAGIQNKIEIANKAITAWKEATK